MKLTLGINPNCSEAIFRFFTRDPKVIEQILKTYAQCSASYEDSTDPESIHVTKPEDVNSITWPACNENAECFWEPHLNAFVLRVGNNDLTENENKDTIADIVKSLGIFVEEADTSPALHDKYARDCTCGIRFFDGYPKRIKSPPEPQPPKTE